MKVRLTAPLPPNHKAGDVVDLDRGSAKMLVTEGRAVDPDAEPDEPDEDDEDDEDDESLGFGPAGEDGDEGPAVVVTSDGAEHVGILPATAATAPDAEAVAEHQAEADTEQGDEPDAETMQAGDDPGHFTVKRVLAHLANPLTTDAERARVIRAEELGDGRKGILGE